MLSGLVAHWRDHGFGYWAVELLESGGLVGSAGCPHPTSSPSIDVRVYELARDEWRANTA